MTNNEVEYTLSKLGAPLDEISPMTSIGVIVLNKFERKFPNVHDRRFKFDMTNGILECYYAKEIPSSMARNGYDDTYNNKYYRYDRNENGEFVVDYYDINAIVAIVGRG